MCTPKRLEFGCCHNDPSSSKATQLNGWGEGRGVGQVADAPETIEFN